MTVDDTIVEGDRAAVHWHATGTFAGRALSGRRADRRARRARGLDLLQVADGLIVRNDAVPDGMALARQIGLLPPRGSSAERG